MSELCQELTDADLAALDALGTIDVDEWSLPLLQEDAAYYRSEELMCLAGIVALRVKYNLDLEDFDEQ